MARRLRVDDGLKNPIFVCAIEEDSEGWEEKGESRKILKNSFSLQSFFGVSRLGEASGSGWDWEERRGPVFGMIGRKLVARLGLCHPRE